MKDKSHDSNCSFEIHLIELLSLRIGQLNSCSYCSNMHHNELKKMGDSDLRLSLLPFWKEVPCYSIKEKAVLALINSIAGQNSNNLSKEVHNLLLPHFNEEEIYRLTLVIKQIDNWTLAMKHP